MKRQFCLPCFLELKKAGKHDITRIAGGKNLKITCWRCKRRRYLDILFTQAAAKITKAGPRTADVKSGVDALVKAGVINTPEYWLQNYGKLQSLDLLLCALGGAV